MWLYTRMSFLRKNTLIFSEMMFQFLSGLRKISKSVCVYRHTYVQAGRIWDNVNMRSDWRVYENPLFYYNSLVHLKLCQNEEKKKSNCPVQDSPYWTTKTTHEHSKPTLLPRSLFSPEIHCCHSFRKETGCDAGQGGIHRQTQKTGFSSPRWEFLDRALQLENTNDHASLGRISSNTTRKDSDPWHPWS